MNIDYDRIIDFMVESGRRIKNKAGNPLESTATDEEPTDEAVAIERGLGEIIASFSGEHVLFAEEENDIFHNADNVWAIDPISSTRSFVAGEPHYAIVVSHLVKEHPVFAAVYDPSVDELFVAKKGKGTTLNGERVRVKEGNATIVVRVASTWTDEEVLEKLNDALKQYDPLTDTYSMAVNYCEVACGRTDGIIALSKDTYPEFAGALLVEEAGGQFTNLARSSHILPTDRIFIGGNENVHAELFSIVSKIARQD